MLKRGIAPAQTQQKPAFKTTPIEEIAVPLPKPEIQQKSPAVRALLLVAGRLEHYGCIRWTPQLGALEYSCISHKPESGLERIMYTYMYL